MKKSLFFLLILSFATFYSQEYFQQDVNYIINVKLNDEKHTLDGTIQIDYTNNSNQTLDVLWFHLWPNAYKNNNTALAKQKLEEGDTDFHYAPHSERGYIDNINFKVNNIKVKWEYHPEHIDICKLILDKPIHPNETIKITTPFFVKIPDGKFSRLGHVKQSYMITQWYPKPAVYDKDGWHIMPYLNQGEFYSEFGNFDVKITLPKNYVVGATGNLQNDEEIEFLNQLAHETNNISDFGSDMSFPKSSSETKTLHYKEKNIHDFGWFADKRFNVLSGKVELPHSKDTVQLWCMFTNNEANLWKKSIEYMHDATYYYSLWNGDYPYKQCTAVDGTISAGGGMEYPSVTVIGESGTDKALEVVIMHEVGHNWFYGILGSNERLHPWMDEGINSHNEIRYMRTKYPNYNFMFDMIPNSIIKILDLGDYDYKQTITALNTMIAKTGQDQPIELHSEEYTYMNYGLIVYMKTAIVFDYLMAYLGEEKYDQCMKIYFEKWKYKHPKPNDLKLIFEEETKENLDWFFNDILQTTKHIDYAIKSVNKDSNDLNIKIKNKGQIKSPFTISGIKNGKEYNSIWVEGFEGQRSIKYPYTNIEYDYIQIDYKGHIPEINRNNNIIRTKGLFKKIEPIKLQILGSIDHPKKTQIFFLPNYSWNYYDKSLFGFKLYNQFLPSNGFSYKINPLYSFKQKHLAGDISIHHEAYKPYKFIQKIKSGILYSKYSYQKDQYNVYKKIEPFIEIEFTKNNPRSKNKSFLKTNFIHIDKGYETLNFINTKYSLSNSKILNPYHISINTQFGANLQKASLTIKYNYSINNKSTISTRTFIGIVNSINENYNLTLSAWNGPNDYTFSSQFLGRSETNGFLSQQIIENEGFIKHRTDITSNNILASINASINIKNKLKIYGETGTNGYDFAYGIGLELPIGPGIIYMPLFTEEGITKFNNIDFFRYSIKLDISNISFNF